jgi:hypothetical protein
MGIEVVYPKLHTSQPHLQRKIGKFVDGYNSEWQVFREKRFVSPRQI